MRDLSIESRFFGLLFWSKWMRPSRTTFPNSGLCQLGMDLDTWIDLPWVLTSGFFNFLTFFRTLLRCSRITSIQSPEDHFEYYLPPWGRFPSLVIIWNPLPNSLMRSIVIVIGRIFTHYPTQLLALKNKRLVQALPFQAAYIPLKQAVRSRRPIGCF